MNDAADKALATRLSQALGSSYTLEGEIGRGGMGVVFSARDERLKRQVAVKVLPPELAFLEEIRLRFVREAETAARLSHPHIVPIHSVGEAPDGLVYFVMAFVDGESVAGKLSRRGRLPPEEARRVMLETADALGAAHALGIIHRDVKPDNILLEGSRGRVVGGPGGWRDASRGKGPGGPLALRGPVAARARGRQRHDVPIAAAVPRAGATCAAGARPARTLGPPKPRRRQPSPDPATARAAATRARGRGRHRPQDALELRVVGIGGGGVSAVRRGDRVARVVAVRGRAVGRVRATAAVHEAVERGLLVA